ncbi:MAG: homoserine dehydrogenase, partial [Acetobacter persici]
MTSSSPTSPQSAPLRLGIAGLGTVGAGVIRLLASNEDLVTARAGRPLKVTAISARDRTRDRGVDLSGMRWYD